MTTKIGTTLVTGGQTAVAGYINTSEGTGGANIDSEDYADADGARVTRLIYQVDATLTLNLIATTGDFTEFPEGAMCTATGLTNYFVDSVVKTEVKGATTAVISMTNIGIGP